MAREPDDTEELDEEEPSTDTMADSDEEQTDEEQTDEEQQVEPGLPYEDTGMAESRPIPVPGATGVTSVPPGVPMAPQPGVISRPMAPPPNLIMRGGASAQPAVMHPATSAFDQNELGIRIRRMQYEGATMAQARQAYADALRYQASRQYQQDLAAGMNPSEALAKNAPLLFASPGGPGVGGGANIGQLASFIRATRPPATQAAQRLQNIHGVGYLYNPQTGQYEPKTPAPSSERQFDLAKIHHYYRQIEEKQKEIVGGFHGKPDSPERKKVEDDIKDLEDKAEELRQRIAPPSSSIVSGTEKRVRVISPQGAIGTVRESHLQRALAQGYRLVRPGEREVTNAR